MEWQQLAVGSTDLALLKGRVPESERSGPRATMPFGTTRVCYSTLISYYHRSPSRRPNAHQSKGMHLMKAHVFLRFTFATHRPSQAKRQVPFIPYHFPHVEQVTFPDRA